jgi:predicted RNase H-like nuclease (RuvC/YqgF family)
MKQVVLYGASAVAVLAVIGFYYNSINSNSCSASIDFASKSDKIEEIYENTPPWPNKKIVNNNHDINKSIKNNIAKKDTSIMNDEFRDIKDNLNEIEQGLKEEVQLSEGVLNDYDNEMLALNSQIQEADAMIDKLDSQGIINKEEIRNSIEEDLSDISIENATPELKPALLKAEKSREVLEKDLEKLESIVTIEE